jgi:hypothetical protein
MVRRKGARLSGVEEVKAGHRHVNHMRTTSMGEEPAALKSAPD